MTDTLELRLIARLNDDERRFLLVPGTHQVGADAGCEIHLTHPTVSRRHAELRLGSGTVEVRDCGSRNGTWVNGAAAASWTPVAIGDRLRFGQVPASLASLADNDGRAAVPADAPNETSETPPPPTTLATAPLSRFYLENARALLRAARGGDSTALAVRLAAALAPLANDVRVRRDEAIVAKADAGAASSGASYVVQEPPWRIDVAAADPAHGPALEELGRVALDLLALCDEYAGKLSELAPSPRDRQAIALPDPPTQHAGLRRSYEQAARIARGNVSVLILGASGTGKELFARFIHTTSDRASAPLVVINCASLPDDLLEAELFGIERGVATGVDARPGKFELADGGTLFLDEIGDMAAATQAKILRVLQEKEVHRIGGRSGRPADVRIVAATNRDVEAMVAEGTFRADLYHRIADWTIQLPGLADRHADILNLAAHFLRAACRDAGIRFGGISEAAAEVLEGYRWPGNVRELEREMQRCALLLDDGEMLVSELLQDRFRESSGRSEGLADILATAERDAIRRALDASGGNVRQAAKLLGIGRSTIYRRMEELGIDSAG